MVACPAGNGQWGFPGQLPDVISVGGVDIAQDGSLQASDAAEFAYTRGAIGVMDLLDARRQLYATRLEAVNALADYARAYRAWIAATETVSGVQP